MEMRGSPFTNGHRGDSYHAEARHGLVARLVERGVLADGPIADALRTVPRHLFIPFEHRRDAYEDAPVDIGHGQTISAPHMVAMMLVPARLSVGQRVLDVGGGSGYLAAVAAALVGPSGHVTTVEIVDELAVRSRGTLERAGFDREIDVVTGDGTLGHPPNAPYDVVIVSAAAPGIPPPLAAQLTDGGRLIIPIGDRDSQVLSIVTLDKDRQAVVEGFQPCRFVPLRGRWGWP